MAASSNCSIDSCELGLARQRQLATVSSSHAIEILQIATNLYVMNYRITDLLNYSASTLDNRDGAFVDFLFDDRDFVVRYGVIQTGSWLSGRDVLISTSAIDSVDDGLKQINVVLTEATLRDSPIIDSNTPVSRQLEEELVAYFHWPSYWIQNLEKVTSDGGSAFQVEEAAEADFHHVLQSTSQIIGYTVESIRDELGVIDDLIIDLNSGAIRYIVIDAGQWLPGRKAMIAVDWVNEFRWHSRSVHADLSRQQIEASPQYDSAQPLDRTYETALFQSMGRPSYWSQSPKRHASR